MCVVCQHVGIGRQYPAASARPWCRRLLCAGNRAVWDSSFDHCSGDGVRRGVLASEEPSFAREALVTSESTAADGTVSWYNSIPVTYRGADNTFDAWESWQLRTTPTGGYEVTDFAVTEPPFDRQNAFVTIAGTYSISGLPHRSG